MNEGREKLMLKNFGSLKLWRSCDIWNYNTSWKFKQLSCHSYDLGKSFQAYHKIKKESDIYSKSANYFMVLSHAIYRLILLS